MYVISSTIFATHPKYKISDVCIYEKMFCYLQSYQLISAQCLQLCVNSVFELSLEFADVIS